MIDRLVSELREEAERRGFSGVIVVHDGSTSVLELAAGLADRAETRPMTVETRLATASGTKGFTALTVASLIEEGLLGFDTPVVDLFGNELTLVDPAVTIEHLLGHTSGVGDYLNEDEIDSSDDYLLDVPVHTLLGPSDYVPILNRYEQIEPPGTRFRYNNGGFIMLALAIERATGGSYHDEVRRRVFEPAAMTATDFLRSDRLPTNTALGYLTDGRTNILHLPVIGTGDGGAYTTASDMMKFWDALVAGRIISRPLVDKMTAPNALATAAMEPGQDSYGLGLLIGPDRTTILLEGMDAGVSFRSGMNPVSGLTFCLIGNNSTDVWPLAKIVNQHLMRGV